MYEGDPSAMTPFPFFSSGLVQLWDIRCMFRENFDDVAALISLTTGHGAELNYVLTDGVITKVYYTITLTATQTATLPAGIIYYDIEFERISDDWVIRPHKGTAYVDPEVTK